MTTLRIRVTKDIIKKTAACTSYDIYANCAIVEAISDIFPNAIVSAVNIYPNLSNKIPLPRVAKEFIRAFDVSSIEQRLAMDEIEFEVEVPDEVIEKISLEELKPLLVNHPTLEIVN